MNGDAELLRLLTGSVVLVGNAVPLRDLSEEIESFDTVIRMNDAYSLPSGLVGRRTDIAIVGAAKAMKERKWRSVCPVFLVSAGHFEEGFPVITTPPSRYITMTTGMRSVLWLERNFKGAWALAGFSAGAARAAYTSPVHRAASGYESEEMLRLRREGRFIEGGLIQ